jgi:acetyltransferase-like isoleucine patch superfamily enzyme
MPPLSHILPRQFRRFLLKLAYTPWWLRDASMCMVWGLQWHPTWRFYGLPRIQTRTRGSIRIGTHFSANSHWRYNAVGIFQPVTLKTVTYEATITIGRNVGVAGCTISAAERIVIDDDVLIGAGCLIADSDFHPIAYEDRDIPEKTLNAPVHICAGAFIGARAIVLKGVTIGRGAVIAAGSVVSRDIPPGVIAAGNPARVIRQIEP